MELAVNVIIFSIVLIHGLQGHPRNTWTWEADRPIRNNSVPIRKATKLGGGCSWRRKSAGEPSTESSVAPPITNKSSFWKKWTSEPTVETSASSSKPIIASAIFWPYHFLPKDFPLARILTWGYQSRLSNFFSGSSSKNGIDSHARDMLGDLNAERRSCSHRPIIFIAHSLGGIVLKQMLVYASRSSITTYQELVHITQAIFFLGTPHSGSNFAPFGEIAARVIRAVGFDVAVQNLESLKPNNASLELLQEEFYTLFKREPFDVITFQEAHGIASFGLLSDKVVPDHSSQFHGELHRFTINANHMDMCRYSDAKDDGYRKIANELSRLCEPLQMTKLANISRMYSVEDDVSRPLSRSTTLNQAATLLETFRISSQTKDTYLNTQYQRLLGAKNRAMLSFVGREKYLNMMHLSLQSQRSRLDFRHSSAWAIVGFAGQGKTQTALQYASQNEKSFKYILWVVANEEPKLLMAYQDFALAIGLISSPSKDPWHDVETLMDWFERTAASFLIIFDNAEDSDLIHKFWPSNKFGTIIVTTRSESFSTKIGAGDGALLEDLELSEALELMQNGVRYLNWNASDREQASKILILIGCHPYLIILVVSQINFAKCSLESYRKEYSIDTIFKQPTSTGNLGIDSIEYPKQLPQLCSKTIDGLDETPRRLAEMLALLDIDELPEKLLMPSEGLDIDKATYVNAPVRILAILSNRGLIYGNDHSQSADSVLLENKISSTLGRTFHMHRLTRKSIIVTMNDDSKQIAFSSATALLCRAFSPSWNDARPNLRREYREFFTHARSLHAKFKEGFVKKAPIQFVELLWKVSWVCQRMDLATYGLELVKTGKEIINDPNLRFSCSAVDLNFVRVELYNSHACLATELGDFKTSLQNFESALEFYNEGTKTGLGRFQTMREYSLYGGIANSLDGLGRYLEAEAMYENCLKISPPGEELNVYEINICKAMLHQGTPEKLEQASAGLLDYLERVQAKYGTLDTKEYRPGHAFFVLGNVRIQQGDFEDAFKCHLNAVKIFIQTFENHHHRTGDAHHKLGWHLVRLGKYDEAIQWLATALDIYSGGQGAVYRKEEIARTKFKLGSVYILQGEIDLGQQLIDAAQLLRKEIMGEQWVRADTEEAFDQLVSIWSR